MTNPKFQEKRKEIRDRLFDVAGLAIGSHGLCMNSIKEASPEKLIEVAGYVAEIDDKVNMIDNEIVTALALYSPEGSELRELVAFLKITNEFERIVIAARKYAFRLQPYFEFIKQNKQIRDNLIDLHERTIETISYAKGATLGDEGFDYADNLEKAKLAEEKTDELYSLINKNILDFNIQKELDDPFSIFNSIRRLERSADHAVNICSLMKFAKIGGKIDLH